MISLTPLDGVHVLRMVDGENRFNLPFLEALHGALDRAEAEGGPLVVTGDGKYFTNGLDLEWMGSTDPADVRRAMDELHRVIARVLAYPAATAAAINGHAFGAGAMLAAALDVRIMRADRGYLCFPEIDLQLDMSEQFSALLQDVYPKATLLEAWTTGQRYGGPQALDAGLVHAIAGEDVLVDVAADRVRPLAGKDPATMRALKRRLRATSLAVLEA